MTDQTSDATATLPRVAADHAAAAAETDDDLVGVVSSAPLNPAAPPTALQTPLASVPPSAHEAADRAARPLAGSDASGQATAEQGPAPDADSALSVPPVSPDIGRLSLAILAVSVLIYMLHWASEVFVPLVIGVIASYALGPTVARLERWRIPRPVSAGLLIFGLIGGLGGTAYALADDATTLVEKLPEAAQKLSRQFKFKGARGEQGAIEKVQKAAAELEEVAERASANGAPQRGVTRVQIERAGFKFKDYLWSGTLGVLGFASQALVVLFTAYFLLASGNTFRRKMVKLAGPTLRQKKITVQALDEITEQIERYLQVQVFTSALVGVSTGLCFWWLGLEQAAVWGVVAGVLNLIPYFGSVIVSAGASLAGFMQFGSLDMALLMGGTAFLINSIEGYALTPWLTARASRMNALAVFVGVIFWGWLWGVWGLLLGMPVMMIIKSVCDRVDDLKGVGELLGE